MENLFQLVSETRFVWMPVMLTGLIVWLTWEISSLFLDEGHYGDSWHEPYI